MIKEKNSRLLPEGTGKWLLSERKSGIAFGRPKRRQGPMKKWIEGKSSWEF